MRDGLGFYKGYVTPGDSENMLYLVAGDDVDAGIE